MRGVFLFFCFSISFSVNAQERVLDFHSAIQVHANGDLTVTETIAVQAEGREIRRGILRDFPTDYRDRSGALVRVPLEVSSVKRNGLSEPFTVEPFANGRRIRIGNASAFLRPGRYEYEIAYRTARQVGFFKGHDELYWNVNGTGWTLAFDRIAADVRLPSAVPAEKLKAEAYTGRAGSRGRDYSATVEPGTARIESTRGFPPREGMTIVVSFPKGIVREPTFIDRTGWFLRDNRGSAAGIAGFALLLLFLWWRWALVGKDPRAGPRFPRYDPPAGLGAAGARYVNRMECDNRCLAAALLGLGQRGHLKIRQDKGGYSVERTGAIEDWLPGERALVSGLLPRPGSTATFGATYDPMVSSASRHFVSDLTAHFGEKLFSKNHGSLGAGLAIAVGVVAMMALMNAPEAHVIAAIVAMALVLIAFKRWLPAYSVQGRKLQDAIEGLRQYLSVAEADELRRMKAPPQTGDEFARLLPYAVALEVEKTWADRFTKVLGAAAVSAAVAGYYSSSSGGSVWDRGGTDGFTSGLSGIGDSIASASTPPGSTSGSSDSGGGSSGGGGGSSGGGGGGGGGSGW